MASANPPYLCKRIARLLVAAREKSGYSLDTASRKMRMSKTYLWELEKGRCNPCATTLKTLCVFYGVSADTFLGLGEFE